MQRAGDVSGFDNDGVCRTLMGLVIGIRFRPINPMVLPVAKEDYRLAAGEPHETLIRKASTIA